MLDRSSTRYVLLLYVLDIATTAAALFVAAVVRPYLPFGKELQGPGGEVSIGIYVAALALWAVVLPMASVYDVRRIANVRDEARAVAVGVAQGTLILAGLLYLTFRGLSRLLFASFFVLDVVLILAVRLALRLLLKANRSAAGHRVLIIGTNKIAASVGEQLAGLRWMGLEVVGYVAENGASPDGDLAQSGAGALNGPVLGQIGDVPALVSSLHVSELIISLPLHAHDDLPNIIAALQDLEVNIKVVPDFFDLVYFRSTIEEVGGVPMIGIKEPVLTPFARVVKRGLDVVLGGLSLIISAPVMGLVALLVRLDSRGPIIFRQQRAGKGGRLFWMYKFRTMVLDADKHESDLMVRESDGRVVFHKRPDDPRLTHIGRLLRRFSLDEMPQLINVLKGEMSLVGPRPELPMIVEGYQPWQRKRFAVPPGMTGWWQVHGRSQQPLHMRTEDDLYYIQNYSLLLDLSILWKTIGAVITGRGAY
jgi:exopolysaccharide biosynthesis polyprenyl glycosylphosphotransferase